MLLSQLPFPNVVVLCVADPCPDPTTYVTEGGQYCDQATDDDTAAGKPPAPLSPPKHSSP